MRCGNVLSNLLDNMQYSIIRGILESIIIRPVVIPDVLLDEAGVRGKPESWLLARSQSEAQVLGARGKLVPTTGGRKASSCTIFLHWASSYVIKNNATNYHMYFTQIEGISFQSNIITYTDSTV